MSHVKPTTFSQLRGVIDKLASTIEVKQSDHDILDKEIEKIVKENKEFFDQAGKHQDIINKVDTLRTQRNIIEENLGQTRANLIELKGAFPAGLSPSLFSR